MTFAYREAEKCLDAFAEDPKRTHAFRRAYRKFKFMVAAYCFVDFDTGSPEERLAWVWEDIQAAVVGVGEPMLSGAFMQLWSNLPTKTEEKAFIKALRTGFSRAEASTPRGSVRRYTTEVRARPIHPPYTKYEDPVIPLCGPVLREWALDHKLSPDEVIEEHFWFSVYDRDLSDDDARNEYLRFLQEQNTPQKPRPTLRLVPSLKITG